MTRRSTAIVVGFVLVVLLGLVAWRIPVPFVRYQSGPTVDILGERGNGNPIVQVSGHRTYPTDGQLRMTTVRQSTRGGSPTLLEALLAWADPDQDLYPYDVIYPEEGTTEQDREESQLEMVSSQDSAIAAALTELGYELDPKVQVNGVIPGSAAEGKLERHDVIVAVNGTSIETSAQVADVISRLTPGDTATLDIRRGGKPMTVEITTRAAADDPDRALIGIYPGVGFEFPFDVSVDVPESIGGPSAGLIFSLAVYDALTPGALTGGTSIAGTGTIDEVGKVGPIGGIRQKIAGAEEDGAELFLVPPANCDEAVLADADLRLVRADTMHAAAEAIEDYAADHDATLPACPGARS